VLFSSELLYQVNELWEMEIETVRKATVISGSKRLIALAINLVLMTTMASRFNSPEYGTQKAIMTCKRRHMHHGIYGISIKPSNYSIALLELAWTISKAYSKVGMD
jgi:hypothetical protein